MGEDLIASEKARRQGGVRVLWHWLTGGSRTKPQDQIKLSSSDLRFVRTVFKEMVAGSGGEVSARRRVELIVRLYRKLSGEGRISILEILANEFGPNELTVKRGIQAYLDTANVAARRRAEIQLRQALASPRIPILDDREISMAFADGDLVDRQDTKPIVVGLTVFLLQEEFVDVFDGFPIDPHVFGGIFDRHHLAEFVKVLGQA